MTAPGILKEAHMNKRLLSAVLLSLAFFIAFIDSRVAWAAGNTPIARVLDGYYDEFTFSGEKGQILFADIKADIYQDQGRMGGAHDDASGGCADANSEDGCSDGCSDGGSDGHKDLCLQVLDANYEDKKICWAGRPVRPGWQRDPLLACPLPDDGDYILRVFIGSCGSTETGSYTYFDDSSPKQFYRLYIELMDAARDGQEIPKQK